VYQVGINEGIILRCTAYQISKNTGNVAKQRIQRTQKYIEQHKKYIEQHKKYIEQHNN